MQFCQEWREIGSENMNDEEWNLVRGQVVEYLAADDSLNDSLRQIVNLNLQIGDGDAEERDAVLGALKSILKGRLGSPFGKRGSKSTVPAHVRVSIDTVGNHVRAAAIAYFNSSPYMPSIIKRHSKSGGGLFESAEDYADVIEKRERAKLQRAYSTGVWDGNLENLGSSDEEE